MPGEPELLGKIMKMYPRIRAQDDQKLPIYIVHFLRMPAPWEVIEPFLDSDWLVRMALMWTIAILAF